ncbi:hypothetical protein HBI56_017150 [Parastagonospora nodorum]|nr:hypothetical protein HBH56_082850 [Parastagonospora nodorum]KAH3929834.1 hypothetical protein HBH54_118980 [Parastagonospora nodorum]KAH3955738.1 hypothetical protein HBH53_005580 [Parastagonospora nodorum]KAH3976773.1 hypothetical protein HBH51_075930 [Parastagonospora nodorum]KAH3982089.1 hypothetical protein HBH52_078470 [Parastagonospora nodorum]
MKVPPAAAANRITYQPCVTERWRNLRTGSEIVPCDALVCMYPCRHSGTRSRPQLLLACQGDSIDLPAVNFDLQGNRTARIRRSTSGNANHRRCLSGRPLCWHRDRVGMMIIDRKAQDPIWACFLEIIS